MVLLLLISLTVLLWMILDELDPAKREPRIVGTNCPGCKSIVDADWMVCPHCRQLLKETCRHCHRGKLVNQHNCPYCGTVSERKTVVTQ